MQPPLQLLQSQQRTACCLTTLKMSMLGLVTPSLSLMTNDLTKQFGVMSNWDLILLAI